MIIVAERRFNRMATLLANDISAIPGVNVVHPQHVNEVFLTVPVAGIDALKRERFGFSQPEPSNPTLIRLVTAFNTEPAMIAALVNVVSSAIGGSQRPSN
jgi:threonine aldolase